MTLELSNLPKPSFIDLQDAEAIFQHYLSQLAQINPARAADLKVGDPLYDGLLVAAYRESIYRQDINDEAANNTIAFANDDRLEHLGGNLGEPKLSGETDDEFRNRLPLTLEKVTTAGPRGSYESLALEADSDVKDARPKSPAPVEVLMTVLSKTGDGTANQNLQDTVNAALSADDKRPLTDLVTVQSATIVPYAIDVTLHLFPGIDGNLIRPASEVELAKFGADRAYIDIDVSHAGIYAAAHQEGVADITINSPTSSLAISDEQASYCTGVTVSIAS